jgi:hypothetical protein
MARKVKNKIQDLKDLQLEMDKLIFEQRKKDEEIDALMEEIRIRDMKI